LNSMNVNLCTMYHSAHGGAHEEHGLDERRFVIVVAHQAELGDDGIFVVGVVEENFRGHAGIHGGGEVLSQAGVGGGGRLAREYFAAFGIPVILLVLSYT